MERLLFGNEVQFCVGNSYCVNLAPANNCYVILRVERVMALFTANCHNLRDLGIHAFRAKRLETVFCSIGHG